MIEDEREAAEIFKALSDANRLKIMNFLQSGEKCVCEILPHVGTSQSNVSQHLKVLRKAGLINYKKDGKKIIYFISSPKIEELLECANKVL